jgi:hypothetical protein
MQTTRTKKNTGNAHDGIMIMHGIETLVDILEGNLVSNALVDLELTLEVLHEVVAQEKADDGQSRMETLEW